MTRTLRDFVGELERAGELVRVKAPVSPILEIAAIADRVSKCAAPGTPDPRSRANDPEHHHLGGPALLFENVAGSRMPVLINAFGSYRRVQLALARAKSMPGGVEDLADLIGAMTRPAPPRSLREGVERLKTLSPVLKMMPRRRRGRGLCQQRIIRGENIDLCTLPMIRCWPLDGDYASVGYPAGVNDRVPGVERGEEWEREFRGRYITLGGIHTIHADDADSRRPASHNIGMYRVQLLGKRTMAMHWHVHHDGAAHWRSWKRAGKPMPVAIALGGAPELPYAATAPLPPGMSELLMAGFLSGRGVELVRGVTVPIWVPENAEIVIEGYVSQEAGEIGWDPRERDGGSRAAYPGEGSVFEGPFGDHTGFYSLPDRYPLLTVTAITHREEPIYPTTVVGLPPQEDYFLGKATERLFLPLLRVLVPDIEDYDLPMFGAFHNAACIKIRKHYPMHARRVASAIWGAGQMSWTKMVFVVGDSCDVHSVESVLLDCARYCHPVRDAELVRGPLDILDHAAPLLGAGTKIAFDCTPSITGEIEDADERAGVPRALPNESIDADVIGSVRMLGGVRSCGLLSGWLWIATEEKEAQRLADLAERVLRLKWSATPPYLVLVGAGVTASVRDGWLFHLGAQCDPGRDSFVLSPRDAAGSIIPTRVFDATPKEPGTRWGRPVRDWPPILQQSDEIRARVSKRWAEYGLDAYKPEND